MSLVVTGLVVGGAVLASVAAIVVRRRFVRRVPAPRPQLPPRGLCSEGFVADVGDVVSLDGDELWLEDAWLLGEPQPVAVLYFAREATVAAFPEPAEHCYRLQVADLPACPELPTTLEHGGKCYDRKRRRPVRVQSRGRREPPWAEAVLAEYEASGGVLWLLAGRTGQLAWVGERRPAPERWGPADAS